MDSGDVDIDEWLPWVEIPPAGPKYEIINIHYIGGGAQLVPVTLVRGASVNRWVVNSWMDLNSFG